MENPYRLDLDLIEKALKEPTMNTNTNWDSVLIREELIDLRSNLLTSFTEKIIDGTEDINTVFVLLTDQADRKVQFHYPKYDKDTDYKAAIKRLNSVMLSEGALGCVFLQHGMWQEEDDTEQFMCLFVSAIMPGWKHTIVLPYTEEQEVQDLAFLSDDESKNLLSGLTAFDLN